MKIDNDLSENEKKFAEEMKDALEAIMNNRDFQKNPTKRDHAIKAKLDKLSEKYNI